MNFFLIINFYFAKYFLFFYLKMDPKRIFLRVEDLCKIVRWLLGFVFLLKA